MQHHHHSLHNKLKYLYQYRGSHTKIKDELYPWEYIHVPSQEKPKSMNHTFSKITRWRNNRKTKINSRSCHQITLVTSFPTSQEFCNSDSVWESYAIFSEDAQKLLLHKISHFSPRVAKYQRENWLMNKWNVWYSIYIVHGGKLVPQTGPTCNSKLQIIKFSFVWSVGPKRCGVHQLQKLISL